MINPKVTIFSIVKNSETIVSKAINSILNQNYLNKEVLVQVGKSNDKTLEILMSYGKQIQVLQENENSSGEAFWGTFKRCKGDIIGCLMADEIMKDGAITKAVSEFKLDNQVDVITGDIEANDLIYNKKYPISGREFDIESYLTSQYSPHFAASYFTKNALHKIGVLTRTWDYGIAENELWYYAFKNCNIKYVPFTFAQYTISKQQQSNNLELEITIYLKKHNFLRKINFSNLYKMQKDLNKYSLIKFKNIIQLHNTNSTLALIKSKNLRHALYHAIKFKNFSAVSTFFSTK